MSQARPCRKQATTILFPASNDRCQVNDPQNEIRAVSTIFSEKESQDWTSPQPWNLQNTRSSRKTRASSAIFQTRALKRGLRFAASPRHCGRTHSPRKSSTARIMAAMLLTRTVRYPEGQGNMSTSKTARNFSGQKRPAMPKARHKCAMRGMLTSFIQNSNARKCPGWAPALRSLP